MKLPNFLTSKKFWLRVAIVILVLILVLGIAGVVAVEYILGKIGSAADDETFETIPPHLEDFETDEPEETDPAEETTEPTEPSTEVTEPTVETTEPTVETTEAPTEPETTPPTTAAPSVEWGEVEQLYDENVINILLIGNDARGSARGRSDTMILLSINKNNNTLYLTSFMRDLYVQIPGGYSDNRINAAYRFGGAELLDKTIKQNFGITVDGNVEVNFTQFEKIIDILGGVEISLTAKEAKYMSDRWGYTDLVEGVNHLDGGKALSYCRIRKIDSDHKRTERQRKVLATIANAARNMSIGQMVDIINEVLPYVKTDLSDSEIVSYATTTLSMLAGGTTIQSGKVPKDSGYYYGATIRGMSVLVPYRYKCNQYLKDTIYG